MGMYEKRGPFQNKTGKRKEEVCWCSPMQHVFHASQTEGELIMPGVDGETVGCGMLASEAEPIFCQYVLSGWNLNLGR